LIRLAAAALTLLIAAPAAAQNHPSDAEARHLLAQGQNPFPVPLIRPPAAPLSTMARLGERIFLDASLSGSGRMSCASCHSPAHHYGPPNVAPVMLGGPALNLPGVRPVPTLTYLDRHSPFSVGPDKDEDENSSVPQQVALAAGTKRAPKTAHNTADSAQNLVPQGGLFWDGRVDTLQEQAMGPLLNPVEMANPSAAAVAEKLRRRPYASLFAQLFGPAILDQPAQLVSEAMFAVARYQIETPAFHGYTSKFDYWLEGKARFTPAEMRGYVLFNDPDKANCGGCHVDKPTPDGIPPVFTDGQFEALGAPRNPALPANRDPSYFDLGICGPHRDDMRDQTQFCGMFMTPTLRNVATRHAFFHNGVFTSLQQVMDFYAFRDVTPQKVYPRGPDGQVAKYDDLPPRFRANVDVVDPPFDRQLGDEPAMTEPEEADMIAFLHTLTDGYQPDPRDRQ
jgi:cytochrome c peroxidase